MTRLKKIMLVDDEAGIRNLLSDALVGEGFMVTQAKDGQVVILAHRGRHALFVDQHIVAYHRLEIVGPAVPARDRHGGALSHQLG